MAHAAASDELREHLLLYAVDALDETDARVVASHLAQGCPVCERELTDMRESLALLPLALPPAPLPDRLRNRVLSATRSEPAADQVWKQWAPPVAAGLHVVRQGEGSWENVAPGITARRLYVDPERDTVTMLVRMEPGSSYVPHRHAGPEQCFVLKGDLFDGESRFYAGDFQCASAGSKHGIQSTESGCLLFIVSSLRDELIA
jgi:anti-sigma factor ChrR (cupin superfamily)